jgi:hypothetical protein
VITFTCPEELFDIIAPPVPAKTILPEWYKKLPAIDTTQADGGLTVKSCVPVLDAFCLGWIMPLAKTVTLEVSGNGSVLSGGSGWLSAHVPYQVAGHHHQPRLPGKFLNFWTIRTPPGYSCLFVPPLNRSSQFECVSAVVDTDRFRGKPINFQFFFTAPDGTYTIEKGTPLVQVIPFLRENMQSEIRVETREEAALDAEQMKLFDMNRDTYRAGSYRKLVRDKER